MIIDKINLNHLRLFECVYRTHSMTDAAKELHLTQSGVSQHIKSLEERLDIKLFDRIRQKLIPTSNAHVLYQQCKESLHGLEETLRTLSQAPTELLGTLSIGMPIEFGNNCIMPLLSQFCKKYPNLHLDLRYGYAYDMNFLLLNGQLDFAFVDSFGFDKRIRTEKMGHETLILCASKEYLKKKGSFQEEKFYFDELDYIEYLKGAPVLKMWFQHHFPKKHFEFNVRVTVMDVQSVAKMVLQGVGAGILPSHHIEKRGTKAKNLHFFRGSGKPLKNDILIAHLEGKTHSLAASTLITWLKTHLLEMQPFDHSQYN